ISFRFSNSAWSEYPLTTEKYVGWILKMDKNDEIINLFMDYETFGEHQKASSGILSFLKELPNAVLKTNEIKFATPGEIIKTHQPVSAVHVPHPISWADEERDLSAWLGNELQEEAFNKLYDLQSRVEQCNDQGLLKDWEYLQISDHFYYMCTKFFSDGEVHKYFNPYESPYEAFINYMNVLSDFSLRLNMLVPESDAEKQILALKEELEEHKAKIVAFEIEKKNKPAPKKTAVKKSASTPGRAVGSKKK
ncbi:MAG: alpha-amylase, partial [Prolixibacteraceae bacterium]|nr:alpha-amylase [Prolixibacteraceae bacterium]